MKVHVYMKVLLVTIILIFSSYSLFAEPKEINDKVGVLYDDRFLLHDTGKNHPERPNRLVPTINDIKNNLDIYPYTVWPNFSPASLDQLKLVHTLNYIKAVENETNGIAKDSVSILSTGDTAISRQSDFVARLAVGAGIKGADLIMKGTTSSAFAIVRPPGHHATSSRGMGFCIYNNIAIVARYLQDNYGLKRILIVDFDVHHGNGTQDIFYEDNSVFYFSVHQHPFYPYSGSPSETGMNAGKGFTLNVELPIGSGNIELFNALNNKLKPAMDNFKPEFILVSAGFDAHRGDLLGGLNYTSNGYKEAAIILKDIAKKYSSGRTLYMLEGGYVEDNISNSINEILGVLIKKTN